MSSSLRAKPYEPEPGEACGGWGPGPGARREPGSNTLWDPEFSGSSTGEPSGRGGPDAGEPNGSDEASGFGAVLGPGADGAPSGSEPKLSRAPGPGAGPSGGRWP